MTFFGKFFYTKNVFNSCDSRQNVLFAFFLIGVLAVAEVVAAVVDGVDAVAAQLALVSSVQSNHVTPVRKKISHINNNRINNNKHPYKQRVNTTYLFDVFCFCC